MLIMDKTAIGNHLLAVRRRVGLTQAELARMAGISTKAYAKLERGEANVHLDTILRICAALNITPDALLTQDDSPLALRQQVVLSQLQGCCPADRETAIKLLEVYLESVR